MIYVQPAGSDILCATVTATTDDVIVIPAGRWYTGTAVISGHVVNAGTATPRILFDSAGATNASPANGTIIHQIEIGSLLGLASENSGTIDFIVYGGDAGGGSSNLEFNLGGATGASCTINGFLI